MIDRLRSSAELWRGLAGVALALEVVGVIVAVIVAIRADVSNAGWTIAIGAVVILFTALGYGLLFLVSNLSEGLAEVIDHLAVASAASGATGLATGVSAGAAAYGSALRPPRLVTRHVKEPGAALRSSPGAGQVVAQLPSGSLVTEVERYGHAVKVTTSNGVTGWLRDHEVF